MAQKQPKGIVNALNPPATARKRTERDAWKEVVCVEVKVQPYGGGISTITTDRQGTAARIIIKPAHTQLLVLCRVRKQSISLD